ncbi:hypothetical protein [Mycolicibacterium sp. CBMA 226]|uniref:hypothetical protein n=1 Tax=Mycolicibacterium sp. CBMA 226 TaxID=2606611 RepID=UPI001412F9D1|nr:hypothetical protein [Mycolicibacterium sp. CBMA 226]
MYFTSTGALKNSRRTTAASAHSNGGFGGEPGAGVVNEVSTVCTSAPAVDRMVAGNARNARIGSGAAGAVTGVVPTWLVTVVAASGRAPPATVGGLVTATGVDADTACFASSLTSATAACGVTAVSGFGVDTGRLGGTVAPCFGAAVAVAAVDTGPRWLGAFGSAATAVTVADAAAAEAAVSAFVVTAVVVADVAVTAVAVAGVAAVPAWTDLRSPTGPLCAGPPLAPAESAPPACPVVLPADPGSAHAGQAWAVIAKPTPNATASAPTRPTFRAEPIAALLVVGFGMRRKQAHVSE